MLAIGELIILGVYVILVVPIILTFIVFFKRKKKLSGIVYIIISSIPFVVFSYSQYYDNRVSELKYVGTYYLTNYPSCDSCVLELKDDNTYLVSKKDNKFETGKWKYRSGCDYWIVDIGKNGHLGSRNFKYRKRVN